MNDKEILEAIERAVGWQIPRCSPEQGLPLLEKRPDKEVRGMPKEKECKLRSVDSLLERGRRTRKSADQHVRYIPFQEAGATHTFGAIVNSHGNVTGLALTAIGLNQVPNEVWQLKHLEFLALGWNHLQKIPDDIRSLPSLRVVCLNANSISELPKWFLDTSFIPYMGLHGGPFDGSERPPFDQKLIFLSFNRFKNPPPEIIQRGRDAIRSYFEAIQGDLLPLNEAKILLVGDGGCGKTSVVRRLLNEKFNPDEAQTHGINIDNWTLRLHTRDINLNVWDFGGQEIMHATHLFFLSERSLYVLVLDGRKEEDAEYWLKHIESFGGNSPVLVVLNKMDEHAAFDVNRRFLQRKYRSIVGFYPVSCKTASGLKRLQSGICRGLKKVDIIQTNWPAKWFAIKDELQKLSSHFISVDEYESICTKSGVDVAEHQESLVQFLHDLGIVVHFKEFTLRHMHILEPRWLTGAVYRIINAPTLARRKGTLMLSSLPLLLRRKDDGYIYPIHTHSYILEIMRKFELCYFIDSESVLIPDLLDIQEPKIDFDFKSALQFRLDYDFLPKSVMPRFIVKKHKNISRDLRWRTGVVLADADYSSTAVVRADVQAKQIFIYIVGEGRRDYLTVLRAAFLEINEGFEKLDVQEKICMPDDPGVTVSFSHLQRLSREGIAEVYPDGANHSYRVGDLLGIVSVKEKRTEEDFVRILRQVLSEGETRETALAKANRIITLQPNFFGFGANLNALIGEALARRKVGKGAVKG